MLTQHIDCNEGTRPSDPFKLAKGMSPDGDAFLVRACGARR